MKVCDYYIMKKNQQLEKILKQLKHVLEVFNGSLTFIKWPIRGELKSNKRIIL